MFNCLKVLDFTNNLAGPYTGGLLADYGAEVIHIEKPVYGDDNRFFAPRLGDTSYSDCTYNRGKKSVVLNLKDPRAIDVVKKLVAEADILLESARPGVMQRLGLDYETLRGLNERLIYCSISAFGQVGPYAERPGYDIIAQAFSGILNNTGDPDGRPTMVGTELGDYVGTLTAFGSISAALYYRERTGCGQHVDVSLARALAWLAVPIDYRQSVEGTGYGRRGSHNGGLCPYGVYQGNGDSVIIATVSRSLWAKLCKVIGREELIDDPRYCDNSVRVDHMDEVIGLLETWLKTFPSVEEPIRLMSEAGIPCIKVYQFEDVYADPHVNACGWVQEIPLSDAAVTSFHTNKVFAAPVGFSDVTPIYRKAPTLGEHNLEILGKCGYTPEEIEQMEAEWAAAVK